MIKRVDFAVEVCVCIGGEFNCMVPMFLVQGVRRNFLFSNSRRNPYTIPGPISFERLGLFPSLALAVRSFA